MHITFAHHLSLSYFGGGEKWLIQLANELVKRGHEVEIHSLPFLLDGNPKTNPKEMLKDIPYTESLRHKIKADVCYVTYNPLSWITFKTSHPRIAGIHSHAYWYSPHPNYGLLPNLANIANRFTSYFELRGFDAVHSVTNIFPINHPRIYYIPNFVDSTVYKPCSKKDTTFTVAFASRQVWQKGFDTFTKVKNQLPSSINIKATESYLLEEEMPSFLSSSHLTLVPSRVDTFGLSIVESMMCETPVVTTPLLPHIALDLPCSYAKSPSEFLKEILSFRKLHSEHPSTYDYCTKKCRQESLKYDKKSVVDRIERMFEEVSRR